MTKIREMVITEIQGSVSTDNSTDTPLVGNDNFPGAFEEITNTGVIQISVFADVASATDGLVVQFSTDGVNVDNTDEYTIAAGTAETYSFQPAAKYFRVVYTNGAGAQATFRLQTILKSVYIKPSSHRVADAISGQDDAELVKSVITTLDSTTGDFLNVGSTQGAINTHVSDVHRKMINRYFIESSGTSSNVNANASAGDTAVTVVSDAAFTVGDWVNISEGDTEETNFAKITAKPGANVLTLDRPMDNAYTTSTPATVEIVDPNIATAAGSLAAPVSYKLQPPSGEVWHIWRVVWAAITDSQSATNKFLSLTALTNGVVMRINNDGVTRLISNWKTDQDLMEDMFDFDSVPKAPANKFGLKGRFTIKKSDAYVHLDGSTSDYLEILLQDDLTGGDLEDAQFKAQGHIEE